MLANVVPSRTLLPFAPAPDVRSDAAGPGHVTANVTTKAPEALTDAELRAALPAHDVAPKLETELSVRAALRRLRCPRPTIHFGLKP